jgi:hypothetical protein
MFHVCHSSRGHPYLAYILETPRFQGPLFGRLAGSFRTFPIVRSKSGYHLEPDLAESWFCLELVLRHAIQKLQVYYLKGLPPVDHIPIPFPETYGYGKIFPTEHKARGAAAHSRDAFVILMAKFSWIISLHKPLLEVDDPYPKWAQNLKDTLPPHYIDLLLGSQVAEFSQENRRFGVVIQPGCEFGDQLHHLLKSHCPVWFRYDNQDPATYDGNHIGAFHPALKPTLAEVEAARKVVLPQSLPLDPTIPPPEQGSRQLPGETWQAFFERQLIAHTKRAASESFHTRQVRLAREKENSGHPVPGRKGAVVWCWEDVDGFRIRTRVSRGNVETYWSMYNEPQRKYNCFDNEWDICEEFDPNWPYPMTGELELLDDGEEGFDMDQQRRSPSPPPPYPPVSPAPPSITVVANKDLTVTYGLQNSTLPIASKFVPQMFSDLLFGRYGFNLHRYSSPDNDPIYFDFPYNERRWMEVLRLFREGDRIPPSQIRPPLIKFVDSILNKVPIPPFLWDLHKANPAPLASQNTSQITIRRIKWKNTTLYYLNFLRPTARETSWQLAVPSAATALECRRRTWCQPQSRADIAAFLLQTGQRFTTLQPFNANGPPRYNMPCAGLGWRPFGYQPTRFDYLQYETVRNELFNQKHARAFATKSGIIWRLYIESLGIDFSLGLDIAHNPAISDILAGPSDSAYGARMYTDDGSGMLWDDDVSEAEMDLVCGVYKVWTGVCSLLHHPSRPIFNIFYRNRKPNIRLFVVAKSFDLGMLHHGYWLLVFGL